MAYTWAAKAPTEVVSRDWIVPVPDGDSLLSYTLTASGCTKDSDEKNGNTVTAVISAGTAGATASIAATATTSNGLTLVETIYLPIIATTALIGNTVREVCTFALRKLVGNGRALNGNELDDAQERLEAMLAAWRGQGADIGTPSPLTPSTVLNCPDWAVQAVRNNLILQVSSLYSYEPTQMEAINARTGLQQIKQYNITPADVLYY